MTASIRPMEPRDAERLAALHAETWRETYAGILTPAAVAQLTPTRTLRMWQHYGAVEGDDRPMLAELDGVVVGFSGTGPSRDAELAGHRELAFLYLLTAQQGSGLGQALFDAVPRPTVLWVATENPRAQAFYRRNGFIPDGAVKAESFLGEEIAELRMSRS